MMQQIWKMWSNFVCPLGPFLLAQSQLFNLLLKYSICYSILPCIYVECVDAQKYLDMHIDYKHSWRNHVASICKKMLTIYLAIITWLDISPKYFTYIRVLIIKVLVTYLVMTHLNIHFLYWVSLNLYLFSHIRISSP